MTQNWFVTWFFMKNAFCKNIKFPLKTSRLAWKNHKISPASRAMMWRAKIIASHFDTTPQNLFGGWGWRVFFYVFFMRSLKGPSAWKTHNFQILLFFYTKNDVFKNRVCKNLRFRSRRQAGLRPAVRRPYAGRPPAGLRLCTVLGPGRRPTGQAVIFPL